MRILNSFTRYLMSAFIISSLFLSSQLKGEEMLLTNVLGRRGHCSDKDSDDCFKKRDHCKKRESCKKSCCCPSIFASFRSCFEGCIFPGCEIPFTIEEVNKGDGIVQSGKEFVVIKCGCYLINFGISSTAEIFCAKGVRLEQVRGTCVYVKSSILVNDSAAVIVCLEPGDIIRVVAEEKIALAAGCITTTFIDTGSISFVLLK